ncbi:MAG TPA: dual specificity protein phosphatase family protein [Sandaracinaceae bacterium LLY-WYZ-13_1]|nr:dual specificity protein phosphatase family protein [Sandaracinaceae bacterium LLY-WYZ-13_1]
MPAEVRVVVDLTSELPRAAPFAAVARYRCVPTLDTAAPAPDELRRLIDELAPEPGPVLLHCAMGHGRSATVAAALLIRRGLARDVDDAVARMTEKRRRVFLHPAQRAAVERLGAGARLVA